MHSASVNLACFSALMTLAATWVSTATDPIPPPFLQTTWRQNATSTHLRSECSLCGANLMCPRTGPSAHIYAAAKPCHTAASFGGHPGWTAQPRVGQRWKAPKSLTT